MDGQGSMSNVIVGAPKEIKPGEQRVALTPAGVRALVERGHDVLIEAGAGTGSGLRDDEYTAHGGRGVLLGGVPGVPRGNVVILGAGTVGMNALRTAVGLGADVWILDVNLDRLRHVEELYGNAVVTQMSNSYNVDEAVRRADLL